PVPLTADEVAVRALAIPVLIPAFRPNETLGEVVRRLAASGVRSIVVVDDGSGPEFQPLFESLERIAAVRILRHAVNLGKGAALKTAMNEALTKMPEAIGVVTADADGQH